MANTKVNANASISLRASPQPDILAPLAPWLSLAEKGETFTWRSKDEGAKCESTCARFDGRQLVLSHGIGGITVSSFELRLTVEGMWRARICDHAFGLGSRQMQNDAQESALQALSDAFTRKPPSQESQSILRSIMSKIGF